MFLVYIMSFRSCCISSLKAVIEFLDNSNNDLKDVIGSVTKGLNILMINLIILLKMSNKLIPKNDKINKTDNTMIIIF